MHSLINKHMGTQSFLIVISELLGFWVKMPKSHSDLPLKKIIFNELSADKHSLKFVKSKEWGTTD